MNAPHEDVMQLLSDGGIAVKGDDLFGGAWGDAERQMLVLDAPGVPSIIKEQYEQVSIQILVRGTKEQSSKAVYDFARTAWDYLLGLPDNVTVNDTEYLGFEPEINISPLGRDDASRLAYSMGVLTFRAGVELT